MALLDKYPIDVGALKKGDVLSIEQLQEITGKKPADTTAFAFAMLSLRDFIQDNTDFTVKMGTDGLHILTDSEAARYNHRRAMGHIGGIHRRYERNTLVDVRNLSTEERSIHAHNLLNESRYIAALNKATKRIAVEVHKRIGLPSGENPAEPESDGAPDEG